MKSTKKIPIKRKGFENKFNNLTEEEKKAMLIKLFLLNFKKHK